MLTIISRCKLEISSMEDCKSDFPPGYGLRRSGILRFASNLSTALFENQALHEMLDNSVTTILVQSTEDGM
jgi:hypothetical protein